MRVADKTELKGAALFQYLKDNKKELINIKRSMPIKSAPVAINYAAQEDKAYGTKSLPDETKKLIAPDEPGNIMVRVVANSSMVLDSHMDVLTPESWTKTVKENGPAGKNIISHIHDHIHEVGAKIGKVMNITTESVKASALGFAGNKSVSVLVFETEVKRQFNNKIYNMYKEEAINQHSIGLQYVKVELAINSEDEQFEEEYKCWEKYYSKIMNPKMADERGYFWLVSEIKLFENSAVLLGSNEATPTLETAKYEEPGKSTPTQEPAKTTPVKRHSISKFL